MNALRAASSAPPTVTSSGIAPAHPKLAHADASGPAAAFSVGPAGAVSPFASLKQEKTVEARVSTQLLTLTAKGGSAKAGIAMGGATQSYQVPDELMALAGRKKAALASAGPPARDAAVQPGAVRLGAASLPPGLSPQVALPSIPVAAPQRSFNWLTVSVVAYGLLCAAYWLTLQ